MKSQLNDFRLKVDVVNGLRNLFHPSDFGIYKQVIDESQLLRNLRCHYLNVKTFISKMRQENAAKARILNFAFGRGEVLSWTIYFQWKMWSRVAVKEGWFRCLTGNKGKSYGPARRSNVSHEIA